MIYKIAVGLVAFLVLSLITVAQANENITNENITNVTKPKPKPVETLKKILQFAKALIDKLFSILIKILGLAS